MFQEKATCVCLGHMALFNLHGSGRLGAGLPDLFQSSRMFFEIQYSAGATKSGARGCPRLRQLAVPLIFKGSELVSVLLFLKYFLWEIVGHEVFTD